MTTGERLTTAEAADRLGVKPETLYAYVSRGLVERHRTPGGVSTFDARDVERLARAGRRTKRLPPIVFPSSLTSIADGRLSYRGVDGVEAARTHRFEEVAEWLWTGTWRFMGQNPNHTYGYTYYSPAPFEVVPHLLPDAHPWWTLALPGFPTNPVWQWCLLPGSYNRFLYVDPVAPVVNPPGSYLGTTNARWLDAFLGLSAIAAVTAFDYQDSGCQLQQWAIGGGFDPWGFGVDSFGDTMQFLCPQFNTRMSSGQCSSNKRLDTYPHHPTTPSPVGLRLTVERVLWGANNGGAIWSGSLADNNAQSFSVLIEGASQYTPSCPR